MDKLKFLKRFENTRTYRLLGHEELKLYIFLLMCADGIEIKGTIDSRLLRRVMGRKINLDNLKIIASNLESLGLAEIVIPEDEKKLYYILHEIRDG
ncbi:MAG: hypothetical protein HZA09_02200 [Nitrospirae bacterium]|nr:hypothetical protein [Nitrospirota bacterium]